MTSLLAALVNGGILSALVTLAVWLALRVTPRRALNAATRYAVWWGALAVAVTLPALYLPRVAPAIEAAPPVEAPPNNPVQPQASARGIRRDRAGLEQSAANGCPAIPAAIPGRDCRRALAPLDRHRVDHNICVAADSADPKLRVTGTPESSRLRRACALSRAPRRMARSLRIGP
jgi:hypothetical protein